MPLIGIGDLKTYLKKSYIWLVQALHMRELMKLRTFHERTTQSFHNLMVKKYVYSHIFKTPKNDAGYFSDTRKNGGKFKIIGIISEKILEQ